VGLKNNSDFTITNFEELTNQHVATVPQVPFSLNSPPPAPLRGRDKPAGSCKSKPVGKVPPPASIPEQGKWVASGVYTSPTTNFDPDGPNPIARTRVGTSDAFIVKFDENNEIEWVTTIEGTTGGSISRVSCDVNSNGEVIGLFYGIPPTSVYAVRGPDNNVTSFEFNSQGSESFIIGVFALDSDGFPLWTRTMELTGPPTNDNIQHVGFDIHYFADGASAFLNGYTLFSSSNAEPDFDFGNGLTHSAPSGAPSSTTMSWLMKFDPDTGTGSIASWDGDKNHATFLDVRSLQASKPNAAGDFFCGGRYRMFASASNNTINIDEDGPNEIVIPGVDMWNSQNSYGVLRNSNLEPQWATEGHGSLNNAWSEISHAVLDVASNVFTTGQVTNNTSPFTYERYPTNLTASLTPTENSINLIKWDSSGNHIWNKRVDYNNNVSSITRFAGAWLGISPSEDSIYMGLHHNQAVSASWTFGPGESAEETIGFPGNNGIAAAGFNSNNGELKWVKKAHTSAATATAVLNRVCVFKDSGEILMAGNMRIPGAETINFGDGVVLTGSVPDADDNQPIVWRLQDNGASATTLSVTRVADGNTGNANCFDAKVF